MLPSFSLLRNQKDVYYFPAACFAVLSSEPNAAASETASSAERFTIQRHARLLQAVHEDRVREPLLAGGRVMRLIHRERKSRLRTRRSRYAYASECKSASLATR